MAKYSAVFFVLCLQITAWFTMALLMFLAGLYLCIVIRYCCGGRGSKSSGAQPLENEEKKESVPM